MLALVIYWGWLVAAFSILGGLAALFGLLDWELLPPCDIFF